MILKILKCLTNFKLFYTNFVAFLNKYFLNICAAAFKKEKLEYGYPLRQF